MSVKKKILIICGEPSGDLHAGTLAEEIIRLQPDITIEGVGGDHLRLSNTRILHDIKELAAIGFFDVIRKLPLFLKLKKNLLGHIRKNPPDAVILVDFSGFNLRLARQLPREIPVFYYISPQVWASREGRVKTIRKHIRKMIVLFRFEEQFYHQHNIPVEFVGHPLLDTVCPTMEKETFQRSYGLIADTTTFALLPGSRPQEIAYILPVMAQAALEIKKEFPCAQFIIAQSPNVPRDQYTRILKKYGLETAIIEGKTYDCLEAADLSLVASGTATLETAIMQKPFVIIYRMNLLNYLLYKPQVKIPYIGMVNIVAGERIIPEFVQFQARPEKIAQTALELLRSPEKIKRMKESLSKIKSLLGEKGAAARAARVIIDSLDK